ncbi:MAG: YIEGIA domain-containing protein [Bacillota bacterium]
MPHGSAIGFGLMFGILARVALLKSDLRQYPTYPHGYTTHMFLGVIASLAGAVAVAAMIAGEWTAVTFFLLVAEQFRGIRSMERDSLKALEDDELVTRGTEYIEDISRVFETRYYAVILVSAVATLGYEFGSVWTGAIFAVFAFGLGVALMKREKLGELVNVEIAPVRVDGADVWVGDIFIFNVGLRESREFIEEHGIGAILTPKNDVGRDTLSSRGQRQAILHDATATLGVREDSDTPEFTPMAKRDLKTGRVGVYFIPMDKDGEALVRLLSDAVVLESARGRSRRG